MDTPRPLLGLTVKSFCGAPSQHGGDREPSSQVPAGACGGWCQGNLGGHGNMSSGSAGQAAWTHGGGRGASRQGDGLARTLWPVSRDRGRVSGWRPKVLVLLAVGSHRQVRRREAGRGTLQAAVKTRDICRLLWVRERRSRLPLGLQFIQQGPDAAAPLFLPLLTLPSSFPFFQPRAYGPAWKVPAPSVREPSAIG